MKRITLLTIALVAGIAIGTLVEPTQSQEVRPYGPPAPPITASAAITSLTESGTITLGPPSTVAWSGAVSSEGPLVVFPVCITADFAPKRNITAYEIARLLPYFNGDCLTADKWKKLGSAKRNLRSRQGTANSKRFE